MRWIVAVILGCMGVGLAASEPAKPQAAGARLGINLSGPADWNTELPFVDVFRFSRPWISQKKGEAWGKGPELAIDEHGWVKKLEAGCWAETPVCTIHGGHYPGGEYVILYDGEGKLEASNAPVVSRSAGRVVGRIDPARGPFHIKLTETNPANYVRNIRVIMPGFEQTYRREPFHPAFLKRWHGVACLRFMDWMKTNGSTIAHWSERPVVEDATYSRKGVPVEVMVDLCNRLHADGWFCMPHLADDEYVRNFATVVKDRLDRSLKAYIEYSNEVWNGQFAQSKWAGQEGVRLGLGDKPWEAGWHYTAERSVQMFGIWEDVFGGHERLVRVLPSQAASTNVSERVVSFRDACKHADALAVAPYVSMIVTPQGKALTTKEVEKWTVDRALDYLEQKALPASVKHIADQKKIADKYGLKLVAYEGGQHMVGARGGENDDAMTKLFHAANASPRMGTIYAEYLEAWAKAGGDVFCHFSSVGEWSKWGSWGAMQYYDEGPAASPKYQALVKWAAGRGQEVGK